MSKRKKTASNRKKPTALLALILILIGTNVVTIYYFMFYQPMIPAEDVPMSIGDLTEDPAAFIGRIVTIRGYYIIAAGFSMLVDDTLSFLNNSLQPDNYVLLSGEVPEDMKEYLGQQCDVKGHAEWADANQAEVAVRYSRYIAHEREVLNPDIFEDSVLDTSILEGLGLEAVPEIRMKYAVLYSGGWNATKAYYRYWNDITHMYYILRLHGYPAENIYVVYNDGLPCEYDETNTTVDYPGTQASMETVFQELNQTMTTRDSLFLYTTNHGGSSGISTYWPNGGGDFLNQTEVASWLDSISCHHMIIFMQQCFSYNFIPALSAPNRVIMTSCSIGEIAYGCDTEGQWDEFSYHFMSAIIGYRLNGDGPAFADFIDADGRISMREAYLYAVLNDSWPVNPLYDDDGDGVGSGVDQSSLVQDSMEMVSSCESGDSLFHIRINKGNVTLEHTSSPNLTYIFVQVIHIDDGGLKNNIATKSVVVQGPGDAPEVTVLYPNLAEEIEGTIYITWTADDPNSDTLEFALYYSDGGNWTLIAEHLTTMYYQWDTTQVENGQYKIQVEVSDDFFTSSDTSDNYFTIDNPLPTTVPTLPTTTTTTLPTTTEVPWYNQEFFGIALWIWMGGLGGTVLLVIVIVVLRRRRGG